MRAAAKARLAEAEARKQAANYVHNAGELADPLGELLRVAGEMVAWKDWLGQRVAQLDADQYRYKSGQGLEQLRSEITLYQSAMRDVAKVIESMAKLDLEARRTSVREAEVALAWQAFTNTMDRLDLTPEQRVNATAIVVEELTAISESGEPTPVYQGRSEPAPLVRSR